MAQMYDTLSELHPGQTKIHNFLNRKGFEKVPNFLYQVPMEPYTHFKALSNCCSEALEGSRAAACWASGKAAARSCI